MGQGGLAQTETVIARRITKANVNYKAFTTAANRLFAITDSGRLVIWDLTTLDTIAFAHNGRAFRYTAICRDRKGQVAVGTNTGKVYKMDPVNLSYALYIDDKYPIHAICFNSRNEVFLVIPYALYDPITKKHWDNFTNRLSGMVVRKKVFGPFWKRTDKYFDMPEHLYVDAQDRIWMTSNHGEFGCSVQIFDTRALKPLEVKFDSLLTDPLNLRSVFNDPRGNIYITSGLQHFRNSGEIYKITPAWSVEKIFDGKDFNSADTDNQDNDGAFIGPGLFSEADNCLYFASSLGFFKALWPATGKLQNPQRLFNPRLTWDREPLAIGVDMAIKTLDLTPEGKLLFLTAEDGIGIYFKGRLAMLK